MQCGNVVLKFAEFGRDRDRIENGTQVCVFVCSMCVCKIILHVPKGTVPVCVDFTNVIRHGDRIMDRFHERLGDDGVR